MIPKFLQKFASFFIKRKKNLHDEHQELRLLYVQPFIEKLHGFPPLETKRVRPRDLLIFIGQSDIHHKLLSESIQYFEEFELLYDVYQKLPTDSVCKTRLHRMMKESIDKCILCYCTLYAKSENPHLRLHVQRMVTLFSSFEL